MAPAPAFEQARLLAKIVPGTVQDPTLIRLVKLGRQPMSTTEQNAATNDEAELRELIARCSKAVRDENLAGIRADHDLEILMFDVPPPFLTRGLDAYMATWKTFFAWSTKPVAFDFHNVEFTAGPD